MALREGVTGARRPRACVRLLRVGGLWARRRAGLAGSGFVLAGRVAELFELHGAAVRAAAERRGWVGLVGGEPGIGKTRLAAACAARLAEDGFGCGWVSCPEDNGAPPFWVWGQ